MQLLLYLFTALGVKGMVRGATKEFIQILISILSIATAFAFSIPVYIKMSQYISNPFYLIGLSNIITYSISRNVYNGIVRKCYIDRFRILPSFMEYSIGIVLSILRACVFFTFLYITYQTTFAGDNKITKMYSKYSSYVNLVDQNYNLKVIEDFIPNQAKVRILNNQTINNLRFFDKYKFFSYYINAYKYFIGSDKINFLLKSDKDKKEMNEVLNKIDFKVQMSKYY